MNSVSCSDSVMWYEENGSKNFTGLTGFIECGNNFSEIRCTANSKRPPFLSTNTYYGYIPVTENIQDCVINKSDVITNDDFFNNEFNPRQNNENLGFIPNRKRSIKDDDNNDTLKKFRREGIFFIFRRCYSIIDPIKVDISNNSIISRATRKGVYFNTTFVAELGLSLSKMYHGSLRVNLKMCV